jgi:hypothetical protein
VKLADDTLESLQVAKCLDLRARESYLVRVIVKPSGSNLMRNVLAESRHPSLIER